LGNRKNPPLSLPEKVVDEAFRNLAGRDFLEREDLYQEILDQAFGDDAPKLNPFEIPTDILALMRASLSACCVQVLPLRCSTFDPEDFRLYRFQSGSVALAVWSSNGCVYVPFLLVNSTDVELHAAIKHDLMLREYFTADGEWNMDDAVFNGVILVCGSSYPIDDASFWKRLFAIRDHPVNPATWDAY
jgi:hypothetical protein